MKFSVGYIFIQQLVTGFVAIASIRLYTEIMTPLEFSLSMLYFGALVLSDGIFVSSNNQLLAYFLSKYNSIKEQTYIADFLSVFTSKISFFIYSVSLFIVVFLIYVLEFKSDFLLLFFLSFLYVLLGIYKSNVTLPYNVRQDHRSFSNYMIIESLVVFVIVFLGLLLAKQLMLSIPITLIVLMVLARVIVLLIVLFLSNKKHKYIDEKKAEKIDMENIIKPSKKEILWYVLPFSLMGIIGWLGVYLDRYVLSIISDISGIATYIACVSLMLRPYNILSAILTNYFRPKLFKARQESKLLEWKKCFLQWVVISLIFGSLACLLFYLLNSFIVSILLSEEYRSGTLELMTILSIGFCFLLINHAVDNFYFSNGSSKGLLLPQLMSIAVLVVGLIILSSQYGVIGAAIARALSDFSKLFITVFVIRHSFKFNKELSVENSNCNYN